MTEHESSQHIQVTQRSAPHRNAPSETSHRFGYCLNFSRRTAATSADNPGTCFHELPCIERRLRSVQIAHLLNPSQFRFYDKTIPSKADLFDTLHPKGVG